MSLFDQEEDEKLRPNHQAQFDLDFDYLCKDAARKLCRLLFRIDSQLTPPSSPGPLPQSTLPV
jgi:hypothetical protein